MVQKEIGDCKDRYVGIISLYNDGYGPISQGLKDPDSKHAYQTLMNNGIKKITEGFRTLDMFTKPEIDKWTDFEKISRVKDIHSELEENYELINSLNIMYKAKVAKDNLEQSF